MSSPADEHKAEAPSKLRCAVVTVSDTRTLETDSGGQLVVDLLMAAGHVVQRREIIPDDPEVMTPLLLSLQGDEEVEAVLRRENVEFPAGRIESKDVDLTIKLDKAYKNLESYKKLPLKRSRDGSIITLSDVARVELGAESTRTLFKGNGKQVVGIGIYQQSDANTIKVANGIKSKIKEVRPGLPPGTSLEVSFDRSNYIKAAIKEVYKTLLIEVQL